MHDAPTSYADQPPVNLARLPFVGRDAELHMLGDALDQALAGMGRIVLLVGDPGIGKTRTAEQLADLARRRGALILWGSCHEWEGAPAYWPWTHVLRDWLREVDDDTLRAVAGPNAAFVAQIIPELRERLPDLSTPPAMEPEARHFQLLAATSALLRAAAAWQPLIIVLDDIHWADTSSLRLLRFLAQEIRSAGILLIATYRDLELDRAHPATPIVADIAREPNCRRITLRGLPKPQVARFVALVSGKAQSPALVDAVYVETEGNPFFVTEVVRLLAEERQLDDGAATGFHRSRVPESVREAVRRRLDRLSDACNRALSVAAVIGRTFDVQVLEQATGVPAVDLLDALDEALRARLLSAGEIPGSYHFSHALVQETLYQETPTSERAWLHLAVGQALEQLTADEPPWAELARHFYLAGPHCDPERTFITSTRAGDAATEQFAWEAAITHYQHALAALGQMTAADARRRSSLLLGLGEAQLRAGAGAGDSPAARASFLQAFELARELGAAEDMARAAIGYAGFNFVAVFGGSRQLELLEAGLASLDPADSPLRVRVLARLANDLWNRSPDNLKRSRALAEQAVSAAQRLGDPTLVAYALWARHSCGYRPSNLSERLVDAAQLVAMAEQTGDPIAAALGHILHIFDYLEAGDLVEVEQALRRLQHFDERAHIPYLTQRVAAFSAMLELVTGNYATASLQVERARVLWQSSAPRQHAGQAFLLWRDLGRLDEISEEIRLPDNLHSWRQVAQAHRMALALERGHLTAARHDYAALIVDELSSIPLNQHWYGTVAMLAEAAVAFDDAQNSARLFAMLEPYAARLVYDGSLAVCHGPIALYLGRLAGMLGRWEEAEQRFAQALATCEGLGLRPYVARTLMAQAEMLARRDGPGDRATARDRAQRAVEVAEAIGMLGLLPQATSLRDRLLSLSMPRFGLTPRELDVLRLIAQGLTDAEVAERLFLSPRTVGSHLTSIYGKLDVSSRSAATRIAVERGLS
jgi:DNA-binding CsgD family transcriptional regulator